MVAKRELPGVTFATRVAGRPRAVTCISVNCHPADDFTAVWRKVFRRLEAGGENLSQRDPDKITPDDVVIELSSFSANKKQKALMPPGA
jgi:hypothetical protein